MPQPDQWDFGYPVCRAAPHSFTHPRGDWRYCDDDTAVGDGRPCPKCGERRTADGHDPCIADLPGVVSACCGHGVVSPYVCLNDGTRFRDGEALAWFAQARAADA
jgi:hypothetical protein